MALPVTVPNAFAGATASIPLSQLDANFNSLSNAINGIANGVETLANINVTNAAISLANITTASSLANGNAASPSLTFTADTDTGLFLSGANAVSFSEGGSGFRVGYRNIPDGGPKNTSYTLAADDVGKYVQITSGGSITIPDSTFVNGDVISMFNNTDAAVTVTCSITTAYIAGTDTDVATANLASRGVATVLFANATVCVITGNVT
jgi:hypothetical protein